MKLTLALAALIANTQAISIYSTNGKLRYTEPVETSMIQLQKADDAPTFFLAGEHGQIGAGEYERVVPARFAADSDDIFMRSMIKNYAIELS